MSTSRYIIGIDLGTTTCSLAYVDTLASSYDPQVLKLVQWEREQETVAKDTLPSFCYLLEKKELKTCHWQLDCQSSQAAKPYVVGRYALRQRLSKTARVVHSAKSWLSHRGVNAEEKILPWHSDDIIGSKRYSPVEILSFYLMHLKDCWDASLGADCRDYEFVKQDLIITIPASFDEVASQLVFKAAELASFNLQLLKILEEPQASFYDWIQGVCPDFVSNNCRQKKMLETVSSILPQLREKPQLILVCDIGGGTSDFTLFQLTAIDSDRLDIRRVAVSDHILLGGDNIDLALAGLFENEYEKRHKKKLSSKQWAELVSTIKDVKEKALVKMDHLDQSLFDDESLFVSIASERNRLFDPLQKSIGVSYRRIKETILEGFFPICERGEDAKRSSRAFKEWGLPYAFDTAISRHLSEFVENQVISAVLFAGGTLLPHFLRERLLTILSYWQEQTPIVLENKKLELSIARGAAVYGVVSRQTSLKIKGGYPRSLYVELRQLDPLSSQKKLLCILNKGFDSIDPVTIVNDKLKLLLGQKISFRLYYSTTRHVDQIGDILEVEESSAFKLLSVFQTKLDCDWLKKRRDKKGIQLEVSLAHNRLLHLCCCTKLENEGKTESKKWVLNFNVKVDASLGNKTQELVPELSSQQSVGLQIDTIRHELDIFYGKKRFEGPLDKPSATRLIKKIELILQQDKKEWDLYHLRSIGELLGAYKNKRIRSFQHESTWLNLFGYLMRPGYGDDLDRLQISDIWTLFNQGLTFHDVLQVQNQWWILWRRIAGGLQCHEQEKIFLKLYPSLKQSIASPEMIMTLGSLERLNVDKKILLGQQLIDQLHSVKQPIAQKLWSLTRLMNRHPLYAEASYIIRPVVVEKWMRELASLSFSLKTRHRHYWIRLLTNSGRLVQDREFDLSLETRDLILKELSLLEASEADKKPLHDFVSVGQEMKTNLFGESLPSGLMLS